MSDTAVEHQIDEPAGRPISLPRMLAIAGICLVLLAGAIKIFNIARAGSSLSTHVTEFQALLGSGLSSANPAEAEALVLDIRQDIVTLKAESGFFVAVAPLFGWLPRVGPIMSNAPELMEIADAGSEAGVYAIQGLSPALTIMEAENTTGQSRIPQLLAVIDTAEPDLIKASQALDRLVEARANITRADEFPGRAGSLMQQLDANLPMAQDGLQLSLILPELMGSKGRRTYLILAQNEDELRPTGGFISGAGLLVVENGQIISINFLDANLVDAFDQPGKFYGPPPQPFTDFMGMDIFLFRDANFWPDFPVSAEKAMELYTYGQDVPLDGAIAIDQQFVRLLLQGIGPVYIPELGKTVNAGSVINEMRAEWERGTAENNTQVDGRKAFMGPLASAIQTTIETNMAALHPVDILRQLQTAADGHDLQIYMRDPDVAAEFAKTGWDGRQTNSNGGDYLLAVDSNFGFNKVSAAIARTTNYDVILVDNNTGQATVTLTYQHLFPAIENQEPCTHGTNYFPNISYDDLINDCYWNYVRVYTPPGSQLIQATNHPVSAEFLLSGKLWNGEARVVTDEPTNFTVFANFLLIPQGQTAVVNFTYQLPGGIVHQIDGKNHYILEVHKQAGVGSQPLNITVTLPPQAKFDQAIPAATSIEGQMITFSTDLQQDRTFEVIYD